MGTMKLHLTADGRCPTIRVHILLTMRLDAYSVSEQEKLTSHQTNDKTLMPMDQLH